jgi:hypothetical protein
MSKENSKEEMNLSLTEMTVGEFVHKIRDRKTGLSEALDMTQRLIKDVADAQRKIYSSAYRGEEKDEKLKPKDDFWTDEMVLRFAQLYRYSSSRLSIDGFKGSQKLHDVEITDEDEDLEEQISAWKRLYKQVCDEKQELIDKYENGKNGQK